MNNQTPDNNWIRMSFKGNKVWAAADPDKNLVVEKGKVLVKYNLKQDYEYRVKPESLKPEDQAIPSQKKSGSKKKPQKICKKNSNKQ